jgi:DNA (cytosine-5)-methyltransferase 1
MNNISMIDLFCGTGGFSHGFEMLDQRFKLVYAIDNNREAAATAKANHPDCRVDVNDIRDVSPAEISKVLNSETVDLIIGGPPCQGFSSLRPNRSTNVNDDRNDLFRYFAKFVNFFRPQCFVLENVVGLVTHNGGSTLSSMCQTFSDLGYSSDWRILNAACFGVPQKRERFILIGSRISKHIVFPNPTHFFEGKVIGHVDKSRLLLGDKKCPPALTVNEAIGDLPQLNSGESSGVYTMQPQNSYQRLARRNQRSLTLHQASHHSQKMLDVIKHAGDSISCIPKHLITSGFSSCYSRLNGNDPATTITVKFQSPASSKCIHPWQDRTITPREAARIQSFPDSYIFCGSLTQIASQIGNAVPPLLGMAVAKSILQMMEQNTEGRP